jgi:outer membrane protein OmpA-like peptidoglycan-associated protein
MLPFATSQSFAESVLEKAEKGIEGASDDAKVSLFELLDKKILDVEFKKGESSLSEGEKSDLSALVKSLDSKSFKVAVAGWADSPNPKQKGDKLSPQQEKLADQRVEAVVSFLESAGKYQSIEKFNMATRSNALENFLNTDDSELKKEYRGTRTKDSELAFVAEELKNKGEPSSVVVVFYRPGTSAGL